MEIWLCNATTQERLNLIRFSFQNLVKLSIVPLMDDLSLQKEKGMGGSLKYVLTISKFSVNQRRLLKKVQL